MRQLGIGIGLPYYRRSGAIKSNEDNMTDGTTLFTFGTISGDMVIYYTETEQVVRKYVNS